MTSFNQDPRYYAKAGLWQRPNHPSLSPPNAPPAPSGYDWTANPYGSVYDSRTSGVRQAGGYTPVAGTSAGRLAAMTTTSSIAGTSGYLSISSAGTAKGNATIATSGVCTLTAHGMPNGTPIYFTSLTGGAGLSTGPVAAWYVVANATTNTFTLTKCDPNTGIFSAATVTTAYTSAAVSAGLWYDLTTFTCDVTTSTTTVTGLVLISRSEVSGPTPANGGFNGESQALVYNKSANCVFIIADSNLVPASPTNELNGGFGPNMWAFRNHTKNITDGFGLLGNCHMFGNYIGKHAWFYPCPTHSDGSHCDAFQIHQGSGNVIRGNANAGLIETTVSSTTDTTNRPIPTWPTSGVLVGNGTPQPTNIDIQYNQWAGAVEQVNIAAANFTNLGAVKNNQHHLADAQKGQYPQGVVAPNAGGPVTIHADIPLAGNTGANVNESGTSFSPYVAAGNTLTWP